LGCGASECAGSPNLWISRVALPGEVKCCDAVLDATADVVHILGVVEEGERIASYPCVHDEGAPALVYPTEDRVGLGLQKRKGFLAIRLETLFATKITGTGRGNHLKQQQSLLQKMPSSINSTK